LLKKKRKEKGIFEKSYVSLGLMVKLLKKNYICETEDSTTIISVYLISSLTNPYGLW